MSKTQKEIQAEPQIQPAGCSPTANAVVAWSRSSQLALVCENPKGLGDIAEVIAGEACKDLSTCREDIWASNALQQKKHDNGAGRARSLRDLVVCPAFQALGNLSEGV